MATWTSASYEGRYLQLTITETVNTIANTSTLYWTLTSTGGSVNYYTVGPTTVTINGSQVYYKARTIWDTKEFPAAKGSTSGSITVAHNSDGKKTITVGFSTRVYYSGVQEHGGSMTLTNIDRAAPTVSFSTSSVTAYGFKISASSSATADIWQYSTNGGSSWTQFSTTAGTSASVTLSSLSPNTTYSVKVRVRKKSNQVYGTSGTASVKTLGGAVVNSVSTLTADNSTVTISINTTVYNASYKYTLALKNGSTTYLTISGLSWSAGTASRSITLTASQRTTLLNNMASLKSFTGTFAVTTYDGSTQIGSTSSKTATVQTTSANSGPTLGAFTYADTNSTTVNITGNNQYLVQGYSTLTVTPGTATAKNGASISQYTATCNGVSVSNTTGAALTVGKVSTSGNVSVTLTVTDSRGYTASRSLTMTVIAYSKPRIYSLTLRRTNEIEAEMQLTFSGSISAISVDGTQKNSVQYVRYRYKKTSETSYGSYTSILGSTTRSGTSFSFSNLELCSLDANSSYDFHLQIQDRLFSTTSLDLYYVVPQGTPLVALRKKKVGINNPNPLVALDVTGDMRASGSLQAASLRSTGMIQASGAITASGEIRAGTNVVMNGYNVMGLVQASIPDGTNLNNITAPGIYFRRSSPQSGLNYPTLNIGMLEVFSCSVNVVIQRYTRRDSPYTIHVRSRVNSTWNAWVQKS